MNVDMNALVRGVLEGDSGSEMGLDDIVSEHSDSDASLDGNRSLDSIGMDNYTYGSFDDDGCLKTPDHAMTVLIRTAASVPPMYGQDTAKMGAEGT